tara:strand:+ start:247 stop:483 length:237 start_codon:yes stop_codon:yes gene_type:complete
MAVKVTISTPITNRVSIQSDRRNVIRTVNVLPSVPPNNLNSLTDVVIANPTNNEVLVYDEDISQFTNKTLPILNGGDF